MVHILDLKTWEEHSVQLKEIEPINNSYEYEDFVQQMIVVSQNDDEIQVMDKKSYTITVIKKPKKILFSGEQIPVIRFEDYFFILPEIIKE
jgi:NMD protein affecting ribosome stability and mRNA decay